MRTARPIVYSELNCPFCHALNEWFEARGWGEDVLWMGVEHEPHLPTPPRLTVVEARLLEDEVAQVWSRAPGVRRDEPPTRPNSRRALAALVLLGLQGGDVRAARTRLFRALWWDGRDISDGAVIADCAGDLDAASLDAAEDEVAARTRAWRERQWNRIPVFEAGTGVLYLGLGDERLLEVFMGSALFDIEQPGSCEVMP
ncbi:MAG: DsbA family protein [Proteobacteria bacterium]|nr:DsbA family protein [Pseudomonadota bacterium]MCP4918982.1 DsbA family protein [Pseudomonadota bacterium]